MRPRRTGDCSTSRRTPPCPNRGGNRPPIDTLHSGRLVLKVPPAAVSADTQSHFPAGRHPGSSQAGNNGEGEAYLPAKYSSSCKDARLPSAYGNQEWADRPQAPARQRAQAPDRIRRRLVILLLRPADGRERHRSSAVGTHPTQTGVRTGVQPGRSDLRSVHDAVRGSQWGIRFTAGCRCHAKDGLSR